MPPPADSAAAPPIVRLGTVDSTQRVAFDLAGEGAPDRTVVVADHQTRGRGRTGRAWEAPPGEALLLSIVVCPALPPARWPLLSLATAVAVAEALAEATGLRARLRWPNDVLVGGRKIAGILLEARATGGDAPGGGAPLVVGIGLNLAQRAFPSPLAGRATSVFLETDRTIDRDTALRHVLGRFDAWRARLEGEGFAPVRARWLELTDTIGREVATEGVRGVAVDLAADGALLVREAGAVHRVVTGEIHAAGR